MYSVVNVFDSCGPVPACTSSESAPLGRKRGLEAQGPKSVLFLPRFGGLSQACSFKLSLAPGPGPPGRRLSKPWPWSDSESGLSPVRGVRQLSCDRQYPESAVPARETWQRQQLSTLWPRLTAAVPPSESEQCGCGTGPQGVSRLLVLWGEHARRSAVRGRP